MADLVGIIWRAQDGTREYLIRVEDITTEEDRRHCNRQYRGYCPQIEKRTRVYLEDQRHG